MKKLLALILALILGTVSVRAQNVGVSGSYYLQTPAAPTQTCSATSYNGIFAVSQALTLYQCSSNNAAGTFQWNVIGGGSTSTVLANGTTATTQAPGDTSNKVASDAFVTTAIANAGTGTGTGTSAATTNFYQSPYAGTTAVTFAAGANDIRGFGFVPPINVTFSNIFTIIKGADSTGLYSLAIANGSGTLVCHPTTGQAAAAALTVMDFPCSEGSVTLTAGQVYFFLSTGTATTGSMEGFTADSIIFPGVENFVTGCTSASGVISGTCTVNMTPGTLTIGVGGFALH